MVEHADAHLVSSGHYCCCRFVLLLLLVLMQRAQAPLLMVVEAQCRTRWSGHVAAVAALHTAARHMWYMWHIIEQDTRSSEFFVCAVLHYMHAAAAAAPSAHLHCLGVHLLTGTFSS